MLRKSVLSKSVLSKSVLHNNHVSCHTDENNHFNHSELVIVIEICCLSYSNGRIYPISICINDKNISIRSVTSTIVNGTDLALTTTNFTIFGYDTIHFTQFIAHLALGGM